MESIQHTIEELTRHLNLKMTEFQQNLQASYLTSSPTSNIAAQFSTFRIFVLSALESFQKQVVILTKQQELFEMWSRRKNLLVYGIPEKKENTTCSAIKALTMPDLSFNDVSRSHRLGKLIKGKPRVILLRYSYSKILLFPNSWPRSVMKHFCVQENGLEYLNARPRMVSLSSLILMVLGIEFRERLNWTLFLGLSVKSKLVPLPPWTLHLSKISSKVKQLKSAGPKGLWKNK